MHVMYLIFLPEINFSDKILAIQILKNMDVFQVTFT